jgi:hypothetical protein
LNTSFVNVIFDLATNMAEIPVHDSGTTPNDCDTVFTLIRPTTSHCGSVKYD